MTPLKVLTGRRLPKPTSALFGSTVLAELLLSLKQRAPNQTRMVEASYLQQGGPRVVISQIRIDGELQLLQFNAKNVGQITPISWKSQLCDSFLAQMDVPNG